MVVQKQHKFDVKTVLSPKELKNLGDMGKCVVCGKPILFGLQNNRADYRYKRMKGNKTLYYCKYSCMRADE